MGKVIATRGIPLRGEESDTLFCNMGLGDGGGSREATEGLTSFWCDLGSCVFELPICLYTRVWTWVIGQTGLEIVWGYIQSLIPVCPITQVHTRVLSNSPGSIFTHRSITTTNMAQNINYFHSPRIPPSGAWGCASSSGQSCWYNRR